MWIVRLALHRPYTFVVMSALIVILGIAAIFTMPTDIFPNIDIPVITVIWSYNGVSPDEMEKRITTVSERAMTTTVNDIEHIESQSYNGVSVVRVFFQPSAKVELAISQVTSIVQTILRVLPPGIFPPAIVKYNASSVPILQLGLSSKELTEQDLYDIGINFIRTQLATVQGASIPLPYGGKQRQIMVDLDPAALYANHLSATDISNALSQQNLILPAGTAKVGDREYLVRLNASTQTALELNDLPVRSLNGATVYMKDVAQIRDGFAVQQSIVRANGSRAALLSVLKNGNASTLDIVKRVKVALPKIAASLPPSLEVKQLFDQSLFVRAAISGVLREGAIAAGLTGLMILLFLGSWRSTIIVCVSIPLSILTSIMILGLTGQTINVMTLGGLALAVGILVDDATVELENVHRNMGMRKPLTRAILDGASQIAVPAFVSTLAICIVFVPVLLLTGAAKYLFTPLAEAVVFAMLMSYFLSRTLVPTMVHYLLRSEVELYQKGGEHAQGEGLIWRVHGAFNRRFEQLRNSYKGGLSWALERRGWVAAGFAVFCVLSLGLAVLIGEDFFPYIDSGQMRLHVRCPQGTRIEETEQVFANVEREIRTIIPSHELDTILDNIGLPPGGINLAFSDSATIGNGDGEILVSLNQEKHGPTLEYERRIRTMLRDKFPDETIFFQAANITNQILNFGLPAPIDVQVVGRDPVGNYKIAQQLEREMSAIPGAVDVHIHQEVNYPEVRVNVDRSKADQLGLTQRDIANSMLISLSSSGQVAPNQWLNPVNGVNYQVAVQTPTYRIDSFDALQRTPISSLTGSGQTQLLSNLATLRRGVSTAVVNHYNVQPVYDIYANVDLRDLGGVANEVDKILKNVTKKLPKGATLIMRGQVDTMRSSFIRLGIGIIFAILLVYLLIVVNFQSWLDPLIILMALPGALSGILWMLFITQTTLNVPSLMGAIMCIGVATANSILMVTFANDERLTGKTAMEAALSAGYTRIRPVTMTALAMIIGMLPMALGLGEGGEQNAPLGRAVIGGLLVATFTTLFFVPIMYTFLRRTAPPDLDREMDEEEHEGFTRLDMEIERKALESGTPQMLLDDPAHPRVKPPTPSSTKSKRAIWLILGFAALLLMLFFVGYLPRRNREKGINREAKEEESSLPIVNVVRAKKSDPTSELLLPGNITPLTEAYIYARASGYIKRRYVDIGDRVRPGQLMAEIEAPDLDQQVLQARAALQQTRANLGQTQASLEQNQSQQRLTGVTLARWKTLVGRGVLSQQEGDQKQADYDNATAQVHVAEANIRAAQDNVRASEANVARLVELQSFKSIRAPFAGVVTSRSVDVGSLIAANGGGQGNPNLGSSSGGGNTSGELFRIAQIDLLRILVNVPQSFASSVHLGLTANVTVQGIQRKVLGQVTRTSNSLDQTTRTLLTEVQVANRDHSLLPGMYVQIQFVSQRQEPPILIPGDSLVIRSKGPEVAVVGPGNKVHFLPITVGRDYGTDLEVSGGLQGGERVVVNPSDDVQEGAEVKPTTPKAKPPGASGGGKPGGPGDQRPGGIGGQSPTKASEKSGDKK